MTGWKLDPAGIQAVLTSVNEEAQALSTDLAGTPDAPTDHSETILNGLMWGIRGKGEISLTFPVLEAVSAALGEQSRSVTGIMNRINAGMLGVVNATLAYNRGHQDMAATFQNEAALAATTGDFSYFQNHGVQS